MTLNDLKWPLVCGADKIWIGSDRIRSDWIGSWIGYRTGSRIGLRTGSQIMDHGSCNIKLEILCKIEHRPHWNFFFCPKTPCSHFHGSVEECCDTILSCFLGFLSFFRCWRVRHVGSHSSQTNQPMCSTLQGQSLECYSRRVTSYGPLQYSTNERLF